VEIEDLISDYELISDKYSDRKRSILGTRLGFPQIFTSIGYAVKLCIIRVFRVEKESFVRLVLFRWEVETLVYLLKSHSSMQDWDFFSSVIYSQDAQKRLSEWAEFLQLLQVKFDFVEHFFIHSFLLYRIPRNLRF